MILVSSGPSGACPGVGPSQGAVGAHRRRLGSPPPADRLPRPRRRRTGRGCRGMETRVLRIFAEIVMGGACPEARPPGGAHRRSGRLSPRHYATTTTTPPARRPIASPAGSRRCMATPVNCHLADFVFSRPTRGSGEVAGGICANEFARVRSS